MVLSKGTQISFTFKVRTKLNKKDNENKIFSGQHKYCKFYFGQGKIMFAGGDGIMEVLHGED